MCAALPRVLADRAAQSQDQAQDTDSCVNTFSAQFVLAMQHKLRVRLSLLCCNLCLQIWQVSPKTKPKTYTFYYKDGSIAAARSSAGGLALLRA